MAKSELKLPSSSMKGPKSVKIGNLTYRVTTFPSALTQAKRGKSSHEVLSAFEKAINNGAFKELEEDRDAKGKD